MTLVRRDSKFAKKKKERTPRKFGAETNGSRAMGSVGTSCRSVNKMEPVSPRGKLAGENVSSK